MVRDDGWCEEVTGSVERVVGLPSNASILDAAIEYLIERWMSSSTSAEPSSTDISMIASSMDDVMAR